MADAATRNRETVHFIGIGGAGMSGLARLLLARGIRVTGSDAKESEPMEALRQAGARVQVGHGAKNLGDPDRVVFSAAIGKTNPELDEARRTARIDYHVVAGPRTRVSAIRFDGLDGRASETEAAAALRSRVGEPLRTTTARNEALSLLRRQGREHLVRDDDVAAHVVDDEAAELDGALLDDERDRALWTQFRRLSEPCQRLLRILMATDRPHYKEVSKALAMSVGSIGPTRMRCLDKLRRLLRESGYPFGEGGGS